MGRALAEAFPIASQTFAEADEALGFSLSELCFNGPEAELQLTANTQPAILVTSVAAYRVLAAQGVRPDMVAGHSLGEYSALVAAGALSLGTAVRLVRQRGELMQQAVPPGVGAMAAILGLAADEVVAACETAAQGQICSPANFNSPVQVVIAGHRAAVERAVTECQQRGARKAIMLNVSAPFHCGLMTPAQEGMQEPLAQADFVDLSLPLVNNVDARIITAATEARAGLIRQISAPVRWTESVELMLKEGVATFVEVGPKKVLCGLVRSISKAPGLLNVEDSESLTATLSALNGPEAAQA